MCMSSSAVENSKSPASSSARISSRPCFIALASGRFMMPVSASISAWAKELSMSSGAKRLSNSIEALIASIMASGPVENRPPHILFEDFFDMKTPFKGLTNFSTFVVLYTAFSLCANTVLSEVNKFSILEEFKVGEMKKLILHETPKALSEEVFYKPNGDPVILESFSESLTLVNFWATWCAPCLKEMPSLSNLQKIKGGKNFNVVTIATMRNSPKSVDKFFEKMSIDNLIKYQDPKGHLARSLKVAGLPLTILINRDSKEVARFIGDADWSSPQAVKLLEKAIEIEMQN